MLRDVELTELAQGDLVRVLFPKNHREARLITSFPLQPPTDQLLPAEVAGVAGTTVRVVFTGPKGPRAMTDVHIERIIEAKRIIK